MAKNIRRILVLLQVPRSDVRISAVQTLVALAQCGVREIEEPADPELEEIRNALSTVKYARRVIQLLEDPQWDVRRSVLKSIEALAQHGESSDEATPSLRRLLSRQHSLSCFKGEEYNQDHSTAEGSPQGCASICPQGHRSPRETR
jgi:hypothetical protein